MNVVLERLREQRAEQISTMDAILGQVEDRDLVDAERGLLEACRQRIAELDDQIAPLAAYDELREAQAEHVARLPRPIPAAARSVDGPDRAFPYGSPGAFLVDYLRAHGIMDRNRDDAAMARVQAAYNVRADQTTADTPGLLPQPIVGPVVNVIDANRPLITSLGGARALGNIPGTTFSRPTIAQHVSVGKQTAEKTALPSQKMSITQIQFVKETHGGSVDISRQDIDWTSPSAWDILVNDLADVYAVETEGVVADKFTSGATGTPVPVATDDLKGWTVALYTAAMRSYNAGKRMPDRLWVSLDVWAALGSLTDAQRVVLPPDAAVGGDASDSFDVGGSSLASFRGDILGLPRIVVPMFSDGTCIVGPSSLFEVYEDVIGLLSVIEPSILGVEVAYGGYLAYGATFPGAFVPLSTGALTLPTSADPASNGNGDTAKSEDNGEKDATRRSHNAGAAK
jgi:HK97 family phage major capsid protein